MKSNVYMISVSADKLEQVTRNIASMYLTRWRAMRFRIMMSQRSDGTRVYNCPGTNETVVRSGA